MARTGTPLRAVCVTGSSDAGTEDAFTALEASGASDEVDMSGSDASGVAGALGVNGTADGAEADAVLVVSVCGMYPPLTGFVGGGSAGGAEPPPKPPRGCVPEERASGVRAICAGATERDWLPYDTNDGGGVGATRLCAIATAAGAVDRAALPTTATTGRGIIGEPR
jgi:hypothetical protein